MLSMLPKFELIPMRVYLRVLANVRRPSRTPWAIAARLGWRSNAGRSPRHVGAVVDADPDVRMVQRRCVVDAVPQVTDDRAPLLKRADDARRCGADLQQLSDTALPTTSSGGLNPVRPPHVAVLAGEEIGWRGRIRTFNPLIQSQVPYR
jgi:hypothetical protein